METKERTIEKRSNEIEAAEDLRVTGYAAVFDSPTVLWTDPDGTEYREVIDKGAFDKADLSNVVFRYNHADDFQILARTTNKTLKLSVDDHGLKVEANLADTTAGKDLYKLIKRKDIFQMSYAYTVSGDSFDKETRTRHVTQIDHVYDVSAVDLPAYEDTSIEPVKRNMRAAMEEKDDGDKRKRIAIAEKW